MGSDLTYLLRRVGEADETSYRKLSTILALSKLLTSIIMYRSVIINNINNSDYSNNNYSSGKCRAPPGALQFFQVFEGRLSEGHCQINDGGTTANLRHRPHLQPVCRKAQ